VKSFLAILLIITQLALQVGIPIHKHFCDMEGAFTSVLLKVDHDCHTPHQELPPCCRQEQSAACELGLTEKDCCSDELQVVKTNMDQLYASSDLHFSPICIWQKPGLAFSYFTASEENEQHHRIQMYRPPPLYWSGKFIQSLHQTWQI